MRRQGANEWQVPVSLGVVQSVADHELVLDLEPGVCHLYRHLDGSALAQQYTYLYRRRVARLQVVDQVGQGEPGVNDVFDDENVLATDVGVEVLEYSHHAR